MKELLRLDIKCNKVHEVKTENKTIIQILFDGRASGDFFSGEVLEGGVDMQTIYSDNSGTLSARYTLEGHDFTGRECRIFIENNAVFNEEYTSPKCLTDSPNLAFLNGASLKGKIINEEGKLTILILSDDEEKIF